MEKEPIKVTNTQLTKVQTHYIRTKKPIPITLETYEDGEVIALWKDTEAWGSGYSEQEALDDLREGIICEFTDLENLPDDPLGKLPKQWKETLKDYLEEVEVP